MKMIRFGSLVIIGFLLGLAITNMLTCHRIDNILEIQKILEMDLEEAQMKIESLEKSKQTLDQSVIKEIIVEVEISERDFAISEAQQFLKELLREQVGKKIEEVDIELIYKSINNRIAEFDDKRYQFRVKYIVLSKTLCIKVVMKKISTTLQE